MALCPFDIIDNDPESVINPVVREPEKFKAGFDNVPEGSVNVPYIISPANETLLFNWFCTDEVTPCI